ncbi:MAG: hypothetical protein KGZ58_02545 [Ignavibacteriales bacterium]|nr:hypothetical protein [Ignavibacteriales bacterium]
MFYFRTLILAATLFLCSSGTIFSSIPAKKKKISSHIQAMMDSVSATDACIYQNTFAPGANDVKFGSGNFLSTKIKL